MSKDILSSVAIKLYGYDKTPKGPPDNFFNNRKNISKSIHDQADQLKTIEEKERK